MDVDSREGAVVDTTVTPFDTPNDCMKPTCNPDGSSTLVPDPGDLPADVQGDCAKPACTPEGQPTTTPDSTDLPATVPGSCRKGACGPSGPTTAPDDTNVPPPTQCDTYTCSSGSAVPAPANVGKVCSPDGFACGKTGSCDACFVPDASCTDEGPGVNGHSSPNAYAWGSIGHCDTGGRDWCGALTAGESSWFSYYDDGTGPLCECRSTCRARRRRARRTSCVFTTETGRAGRVPLSWTVGVRKTAGRAGVLGGRSVG